jgi:hypothetical protein
VCAIGARCEPRWKLRGRDERAGVSVRACARARSLARARALCVVCSAVLSALRAQPAVLLCSCLRMSAGISAYSAGNQQVCCPGNLRTCSLLQNNFETLADFVTYISFGGGGGSYHLFV